MAIWPGRLVVRGVFSYIIMIHLTVGSVGIVIHTKIEWLVWFDPFTFLILYFIIISAILYHEILLNLQISSVFWQISLCILWNPWISALNLQYFKLKSIVIVTFSDCCLSSPVSKGAMSDAEERKLFQWSVSVFIQFRFVLNYWQYLQYSTLKS